MSRSALIKSSVAKKVWMALTGLFLCVFLIGHLAGNLQLLIPGAEGKEQFNLYADFMHNNIGVQIVAKFVFFSIIFHAIDGIVLTIQNRKARPVRYVKNKPENNTIWSSRNMGVLGTVILVFIAVHLQNFYWPFYYGRDKMPEFTTTEGNVLPDLHEVVLTQFSPATSFGVVFVIFYVISMIALAFHLWHGVYSGFQSMGWRGESSTWIKRIGQAFAVIIPLLFAIIPVWLYIAQL